MTSLSFQSGVRKANKKIDKLQKKTSKDRSRILEHLKDKAVIRYYRSIDVNPEEKTDFYKGYYIALSYYFYRGIKFDERQEF